ncbi:MAG: SDR family NAD(P)-dependent oxidoreductase [Immundisolibacterales bacterium]|nr:SDR family NAD(P)-dependent oxidoreductase [Immundisolibacterales bacterium]
MTDAELPLRDKVALVTGASTGIGRAIAVTWARAGAKVACAARSAGHLAETIAEIEAAGGTGLAVRADVTSRPDVERMLEETATTFGGLDLLLINAGGNLERNLVGEDDPENWAASVQLNLVGAYSTAREAIAHLKARGGGRIFLMGSGMGHRAGPGSSSYAVAKAGLWMLTRVLAQELVEHDITVNEIIPGPVWTPATKREYESTGWSVASIPHEWVKQPEEVAPLALFLASQPAPGPTAQSFSLMRRDK